ncbi:MAG: hypothetical protein H6734_07265 [Alphaproteobacteria bacterium]|nr:hypothetical protein [Alphaproteobacteria bacterium]
MRELVLLPVVLAACGRDKPLLIDATLVDDRIDRIEAAIATCESVEPTVQARMAGVRRAVVLAEATRAQALAARRFLPRTEAPLLAAGTGSSGSCGGSVTVDFEHANGDTDYTAVFEAFCMTTEDGDVVLDGTVRALEDGTPTDAGPMIEALEMETDGPVSVEVAGEAGTLEVAGVRTVYGAPETWSPGIPDASSPDVTTVDRITLEHAGDTYYVEGMRSERSGAFPAMVTITAGTVGLAGDGTVEVTTGEPLEVAITGAIGGGTIVLTGRDGTTATLHPRPGMPGAFDIDVNGQPHDRALDCTSGMSAAYEAAAAVLAAFPVY